jgi:hypothetical protein
VTQGRATLWKAAEHAGLRRNSRMLRGGIVTKSNGVELMRSVALDV